MNTARVVKLLRELAEALEQEAANVAEEPRPTVKATKRGHENLERAYRRNGIRPSLEVKKPVKR